MLFDVGRASGTKLCRLLWNTNVVEIELSSLCLPLVGHYIEFLYCSVKRQHWYRGVPLQRQLVFPCTRSCYNCKMVRCPGKRTVLFSDCGHIRG